MLIEGLSSKRKTEKKKKKKRKKGEQKLALSFFCARKNGDCSVKFRRHQDSGHDGSLCRPNGFAAQDQSSKCRFLRSALQTSPYDVRKTTKIGTTCMYYREILTVRALRSSRTIEYYKGALKTYSTQPTIKERGEEAHMRSAVQGLPQ